MKIKVVDGNAPVKCTHWTKNIMLIVMVILTGFSVYIAYRNSKPVCNDLRAVKVNEYTRTLECVYDLGDIPEDQADVLIIKDRTDYIH